MSTHFPIYSSQKVLVIDFISIGAVWDSVTLDQVYLAKMLRIFYLDIIYTNNQTNLSNLSG